MGNTGGPWLVLTKGSLGRAGRGSARLGAGQSKAWLGREGSVAMPAYATVEYVRFR